jgi:hypothetical protein
MHADLMGALAEAGGLVAALSYSAGITSVVAVVPGSNVESFTSWLAVASNGQGRVLGDRPENE